MKWKIFKHLYGKTLDVFVNKNLQSINIDAITMNCHVANGIILRYIDSNKIPLSTINILSRKL